MAARRSTPRRRRWLWIACLLTVLLVAVATVLVLWPNGSGLPRATVVPTAVVTKGLPLEAQPEGRLACADRQCFTLAGWFQTLANTNVVYHDWIAQIHYGADPPVAAAFNRFQFNNLELGGLDCPLPRECLVAGTTNSYNGGYALPVLGVETSRHGTWRTLRVPAGTEVQLMGLACSTSRYCVAAFALVPGTSNWVSVFNGRDWSALLRVPGATEVDGVSCVPSNRCYLIGTQGDEEVLITATGSEMTAQRARIQHGGIEPSAISCPSTAACVIVGLDENPLAGVDGFSNDGRIASQLVTHGRMQYASDISRDVYAADLQTLACSSPTRCVAGGSVEGYEGIPRAVLFDEVAGRWIDDSAPFSSLGQYGYADVQEAACTPNGTCEILGSYSYEPPPFASSSGGPSRLFVARDADGAITGLADLGNAGSWQLGEVQCPVARMCLVALTGGKTGSGLTRLFP